MSLRFKLAELRENLATCEKYSHLPELQPRADFCKDILDEVEDKNYESIYHAAAAGVTLRDTEIDRLQRVIYGMLPHKEAAEIIDAAPRPLQRNVIRETEMNELKQKLDDARAIRDKAVAKKSDDVVNHAYRIVSTQGAVEQAKKALYIQLREDYVDPFKFGSEVKHRDL